MKQSAFKESDKKAFTKNKWTSTMKKPIQATTAKIKSGSNPQTGKPKAKLTTRQVYNKLHKIK